MSLRIAAAAAAALLAAPALAADCRVTPSVVNSSKSDSDNRTAGGHVALHTMDVKAPLPKSGDKSQLDKTAFKNWSAFQTAFNKWKSGEVTTGIQSGPQTCGTKGSAKDCVLAEKLGITQAWKCKAVDANGICTSWAPLTGTLYVGFWYVNSSTTNGKWIINTAYPSTDNECN